MMGYTKSYQPERYFHIQEICDEVMELSPGDGFMVDFPSLEDRDTVRMLLYDWMHHMSNIHDYNIHRVDTTDHKPGLEVKRVKKPQFSIIKQAPTNGLATT